MMPNTWLILDANYLCHRAFHAMGHLEFHEVRTGTVFGFLRDVLNLQERHDTERIIFCFDHGRPLRCDVYSQYKIKRREKKKQMQGDELAAYREFYLQVKMLRTTYLKNIGFRNVFYQHGYEADDIIASVVQDLPKEDNAIIVSADHDLFQLLDERVKVWNAYKQHMMTEDGFEAYYNIHPSLWVQAKSIAGCSTDNIDGVPGVGEKTAIKWLRGELPKSSKAGKKILEMRRLWQANMRIVRLPYPDVYSFDIRPDRVTAEGWDSVAKELGMKSMSGILPIRIRKTQRQGFGVEVRNGTKQ